MENKNIPEYNVTLYTKLKGDKSFKATDFKGNQVGNLVHAPLVKPDRYLEFLKGVQETAKDNPDVAFQIREFKTGRVWYDSEEESKDKRQKTRSTRRVKDKKERHEYITKNIKAFIPVHQLEVIGNGMRGEEEDYFKETLERLDSEIEAMPKVYETDSIKLRDKIAHLHYFSGSSDWYIVEKDSEPEQLQAFGYVILNGDLENAELGYISIEELKGLKTVELDLHWTPKTIGEILDKKENPDSGSNPDSYRDQDLGSKKEHPFKFNVGDTVSIIDHPESDKKNYWEVTRHENYNNSYGWETVIENDITGERITMFENLLEAAKVYDSKGQSSEQYKLDLNDSEKVYTDLKSCLVAEGDDESLFIFEGKEFTNKESGKNEKWIITGFFKYGIIAEYAPKNKLSGKKESVKLTFNELRRLQEDGDIEISGIDNLKALNHCLKILEKCIDNIDIKEELSHTKKETSETKKELSEIKSKIDKQKEDEDLANLLMGIEAEASRELNISSGSQLYADLELQQKYKSLLDKKVKQNKIVYPLDMSIHDILEDENHHSLNQYLYLSNAFGEKERDEWVAFLEKLSPDRKSNFLNLHIFFPGPLGEKLTKEVLTARLKILKKMDEKNPSSVLKTRIKLINKIIKGSQEAGAKNQDKGGGVEEEEVYIEFLNKEKGFQKDKKVFKGKDAYKDAEKWAKETFERFDPDMIKYSSYCEGGAMYAEGGKSNDPDAYAEAQDYLNTMVGIKETSAKNTLRGTRIEEKNDENIELDSIKNDIATGKFFEMYKDGGILNDSKKSLYEKIDTLYNIAMSRKTGDDHVIIGVVNDKYAALIQYETGFSVRGHNIVLTEDSIRHTINRHGDIEKEKQKSQVAVTKEDFKKIIDVITGFNSVEKGDVKNSLVFKKMIGDEYYVVEDVITVKKETRKGDRLEVRTMYIKKLKPA